MAARKVHTVPAFKTKHEDSSMYAAFKAPSIPDLLAAVGTAELRAAATDKALVSRQLQQLAARVVQLKMIGEPTPEQQAELEQLPAELNELPASVMAKFALEASPDDAAAKLLQTLADDPRSVPAAAAHAYTADPTDATALFHAIGGSLMSMDDVTLDATVLLNGEKKPLREWLSTLIELDEYRPWSWHIAADILRAQTQATREVMQKEAMAGLQARLSNAGSESAKAAVVSQLRQELMDRLAQAPAPVVRVFGENFTAAMCLGRVYEVAVAERAAFGDAAVPAVLVKLSEMEAAPRLDAVMFALFSISQTLMANEDLVVLNGAETLTEMSSATTGLNLLPTYGPLWGCLAGAARMAEQPTVSFGGKTYTPVECAARGCSLDPTSKPSWEVLHRLLTDAAARGEGDEALAAKYAGPAVLVGDVELPAGVIDFFIRKPPPSREVYEALIPKLIGMYMEQMQKAKAQEQPSPAPAATAPQRAPIQETSQATPAPASVPTASAPVPAQTPQIPQASVLPMIAAAVAIGAIGVVCGVLIARRH